MCTWHGKSVTYGRMVVNYWVINLRAYRLYSKDKKWVIGRRRQRSKTGEILVLKCEEVIEVSDCLWCETDLYMGPETHPL